MDSRLNALAEKFNFQYTRYSDDLTFSGEKQPDRLIRVAEKIIREEGFSLAKKKTRVRRSGASQRVTGLVVNSKPNVPQEYYRKIRAIIYNCKKFGIDSQNKDDVPNFKAHLYGHAHYINSINPGKGRKLLDMLDTL